MVIDPTSVNLVCLASPDIDEFQSLTLAIDSSAILIYPIQLYSQAWYLSELNLFSFFSYSKSLHGRGKDGGSIDPSTELKNTGEVDLILKYGSSTTYRVKKGESKVLATNGSTPIEVQAEGLTISTIEYPNSSSFTVKKGVQVKTAKFTLTIPVSD
jgi:hypothetical protein